jgi:hypothetical protein
MTSPSDLTPFLTGTGTRVHWQYPALQVLKKYILYGTPIGPDSSLDWHKIRSLLSVPCTIDRIEYFTHQPILLFCLSFTLDSLHRPNMYEELQCSSEKNSLHCCQFIGTLVWGIQKLIDFFNAQGLKRLWARITPSQIVAIWKEG